MHFSTDPPVVSRWRLTPRGDLKFLPDRGDSIRKRVARVVRRRPLEADRRLERDLGRQPRPLAGRAGESQRAAERLDAVGEALQARAARAVGAADAVVGDGQRDVGRRSPRSSAPRATRSRTWRRWRAPRRRRSRRVASTSSGSRSTRTSSSTGTGARSASEVSAPSRPPSTSSRGCSPRASSCRSSSVSVSWRRARARCSSVASTAGEQAVDLGQPLLRALAAAAPRARAARGPRPTSSRRREATSSPARARRSACSATFDASRRAADATASTSAGSASTAASCTSTANGLPSRSTRVSGPARLRLRQRERAARIVQVGARVRRPEADRELGVAEHAGEPVAQRPRAGLAELDDEVGHRRHRRAQPRVQPHGGAEKHGLEGEQRGLATSSAGTRARAAAPPASTAASATAAWSAVSRSRRAGPVAVANPRAATATSAIASTTDTGSLRHTGVASAAAYPTATARPSSRVRGRKPAYATSRWTSGPRYR